MDLSANDNAKRSKLMIVSLRSLCNGYDDTTRISTTGVGAIELKATVTIEWVNPIEEAKP